MTGTNMFPGHHQLQQQSQQHRLALTQELKQSLQILRMSSHELEQYLEQQAQHNPMIELEPASPYPGKVKVSESPDDLQRTPIPSLHHYSDSGTYSNMPLNIHPSLEQFLLDQLRWCSLPSDVMQAARYLAGSLNENGYLTLSLEEISLAGGFSIETVNAGLMVIQSLDPAGVGARSVKESLLLQIQRDSSAPVEAYAVVEDYLEHIARGNIKEISEHLGISQQQTRDIIHYIRTVLKPRPASGFTSVRPEPYFVPDASIRVVHDQIQVAMNADRLPKLSVNSEIESIKRKQAYDKEAVLEWQEQLKAARILIANLEQRSITLGRVLTAMAEEQQAFIRYGLAALKPLTLKALATRLDLHPSTISRAIRHKYVQTPHGIYALKQLLSTGLPSNSEAQFVSAEHIRQRIRQIVSAENSSKPYSDRKLTELLYLENGIVLSRRTVTKYREQLHILSSPYRKHRRQELESCISQKFPLK